MIDIATFYRRARYRAVTWTSTRQHLYYGLRKLTHQTDHLCIRRDTDIVIEGYPRSANSTTVHGFKAMQDRPLHIAHHKHHAAQLLRAAAWRVPAVCLIRAPREAMISNLALVAEARHRAGKPETGGLSLSHAMFGYIAFYEAAESTLDHVVIGRFEEVINDVSGLITRVNARFGTNFRTAGGGRAERSNLGWHAMPNEIRARIKKDLERRFETALMESSSLRRQLARAEGVHRRYVEQDEHAG